MLRPEDDSPEEVAREGKIPRPHSRSRIAGSIAVVLASLALILLYLALREEPPKPLPEPQPAVAESSAGSQETEEHTSEEIVDLSPVEPQGRYLWRSNNSSLRELPNAIANLLVALYNAERLPTRVVKDTDGRTAEQILRDEGLLVGPHLPVSLDSLLCDLNGRICRRELTLADPSALSNPSAHLGGFRFSQGTWTNSKTASFVVPAVQFEEYEAVERYYKSHGEAISGILAARGVTCESFGVPCEQAVETVNFDHELAQDYEGWVVLPTRGLRAMIDLQAETDEQAEVMRFPSGATRAEHFTSFRGDADEVLVEALSQQFIIKGKTQLQSRVQDEPEFDDQKDLFELIRHPAVWSTAWPPAGDWSKGRIAVLDGWVDEAHCDIGTNVHVHNVRAPPDGEVSAARCGEEDPAANAIQHHGTHIVALLGGGLNGEGMAGLIPLVEIHTWEINSDRLTTSRHNEFVYEKILEAAIPTGAAVFNVSWAYPDIEPPTDLVRRAVKTLSTKLFVVAAGNETQALNSGNCPWLPGCLSELDNVITVIGLDREAEPALWEGSNSSPQFHVGGIAEDVLSATRANRLGRLSGTSQAVPQVTSTAAYLAAIAAPDAPGEVTPLELKNRIVYTADYHPPLREMALGGRLDMERALDIHRIVVRTVADENGASEVIKGNFYEVLTPSSSPRKTGTLYFVSGGKRIEIAVENLKRLIRAESGRYVAFYTPDEARGKLRRCPTVDECQTLTSLMTSAVLAIDTENGRRTIPFNRIADFTAPMWAP